MSQSHVDFIMESLNIGVAELEGALGKSLPPPTLEMFRIDKNKVLAIPESYSPMPEELYCPVSDVTRGLGLGVHPTTFGTEVIGTNDMCLFCFKFVKE
jgi:hypothetical protein